MGRHYLYRHVRLDDNSVFYIGIGTKPNYYDSYEREYSRAHVKSKRSDFWKNVVNKTDYEIEILIESDDYDFIKGKEIEFISLYGRKDKNKGTLVNLTDGGDGTINSIISEETREKLRNRKRNSHTEDTKLRISIANTGRVYTPEQIQRYRDTAPKGQDRYNSILLLDVQMGIYYYSIKEAAKCYGISSTFLTNMLKGINRNTTNLVYAESDGIYPIIPEIKPHAPYEWNEENRLKASLARMGINAGSKNGQAKKVINVLTGKIHLCAKDACENTDYKCPYFVQMISTTSKAINKTPFEYYNEEIHVHLLK